jgi:hypothetical protein
METDEEVALKLVRFLGSVIYSRYREPICQEHHDDSGDDSKNTCDYEAPSTIATPDLASVNELTASKVKRRDGRFVNKPLGVHSAHEASRQRSLEITDACCPISGEVSGPSWLDYTPSCWYFWRQCIFIGR